jgi:hypothetical protein
MSHRMGCLDCLDQEKEGGSIGRLAVAREGFPVIEHLYFENDYALLQSKLLFIAELLLNEVVFCSFRCRLSSSVGHHFTHARVLSLNIYTNKCSQDQNYSTETKKRNTAC